ncbi:hypothetical protein ACSHWG_07700 [Leucobacter sp. Z1108]|uniref:hypothetical protein n=1 Tax=Leucobacter sp. Z1108 TaxID=3439066 RepID=UPI003F330618
MAPLEVVTTDEDVEAVLKSEVTEPTVTVFAETPTVPEPGDPCYPAVCIDNGTILLAVNPTGELNADDGTGSEAGPGDVGLHFIPTGNEATSPGCLCEGWGVADPATGTWGGANIAELGEGGENLTLESFEWTDSTAKSVVLVNDESGAPVFRVTHEYVPSPLTPNLYQVNVSIQNVTGETIAVVQYRRVMDWDIEPTEFDELVTLDTGTAVAITFTSNDGFASSNPLDGPSDIGFTGNFTNAGPDDHGALFDFTFGALSPGQVLTFITFYGAAANEALAIEALRAVGAEAYSFGKPNLEPYDGSPNTFIFAFGNVGGSVIFPTDSEPETPAAVLPAPAPQNRVPAMMAAAPMLEVTGAGEETGLQGMLAATLLLLLGGVALGAGRRLGNQRS